jgi:phosphotransferase system enzyme I (PtsI)
MSLMLNGIGVSRGVAIGRAHFIRHDAIEVLESAIPAGLVEDEVSRFRNAVETARLQLNAIRDRIPAGAGADISAFIDTHLLMLDDATLATRPVQMIRDRGCNAEWALKLQRDAIADVFDQMDDAYLRTRLGDIDHVINRIQRILLINTHAEAHAEDSLQGAIVLADDLTPAETALLAHQGAAAFATGYGGPLSHTAIMARSGQLPAVVGLHGVQNYIHDGDEVILDGEQGVLVADADPAIIEHYRRRIRRERERQSQLSTQADSPAVSLDGIPVTLMTNIELPGDVESAGREHSSGVGLYRTEFLFMNRRQPPDEEEQYGIYTRVVDSLHGKPLTIRTLDMGADKQVDGAGSGARSVNNPALGLRAIRLCLKDPDLFLPQLRAILRASAHGPVRLMIPMLSNMHELQQVLQLVSETRNRLERSGLAFDPAMPVGGMIEIPAAALSAGAFAGKLDFLSIGTNDLIQYTLAIDRVDDEVNYLYDPLHPAVLQLIRMSIEAGRSQGIPVGMCGEIAGDPRYTRLLLGMGLTEFSMHHTSLQEVKRVINQSSITELAPQVSDLMQCTDPASLVARLEALNSSVT